MPSNLPDGQQLDLFGPRPAPANPSARQVNDAAQTMSATSGLCSSISSASAALQRCLASKLLETLDVHGSLEYSLTWKSWAMPLREPICALRASVPRISGKGYTGWPTPNAGPQNDTDSTWQERRARIKAEKKNGNGFGMTLGMAAQLTCWASPICIAHRWRHLLY